ncbi:MAG: hypothetical protein ACON5I_04160 [Verrucomicrobiales bacterium]
MLFRHIFTRLLVLVFAKALCLCVAICADKDIEFVEAKTALEAAIEKNNDLIKQLAKFEKINSNLKTSLMASNAEAVEFRKSYNDVRLQLEAFGIESVTDGQSGIEARLLKAMNDIRILEEEKLALSESLINLSDVTLRLIDAVENKKSDNELIKNVKDAVDDSDIALGIGRIEGSENFVDGTIHEASIIGVKDDHGVVVLNIGTNSGAKIGMPFKLFRKDRPVGTSIIIDVRDNISAALIKNLKIQEDYPKVGDLASVDTTQK